MKYLINKFLFISVLLLSFSSCKKELDLKPTDTIDETKAYQTVGDLEKGLIGMYSSFGAGLANGIYINALLSDELKVSGENRGQGQFTFKWQYSSGNGEHNAEYTTLYRAIDRGNRILAIAGDIPAANAAEVTLKSRVLAEVTALRGMSLYELLVRFMPAGYNASAMGVPIMLESNLTGKPSRNSVGEVVAQIEADLTAARASADMPNSVADGLRLSKAAIAGYQARLALLKREWQSAITYATDAITLSGNSLANRALYPAIWTDATNTEVIFRLRNNYTIQTNWRDTNGDVFFEPADKLKSQYIRDADIRFPTFFGSASGDTSIVVKYPGSSFGPQRNDIKAVRVSEMYLIRAEAYAELNQLGNAATEINAIRTNRISGYTDVTFASKDEAIEQILNERYKELAYEGFRFFDLKRRNLPVERIASDVQSTAWQTLAVGDYKFALPIPQDEIFANPNTQQNTGY